MTLKQRDYLYDNYKAFLIIMVVLGHFIEMASEDNLFLHCMKWIIFAFHMPAFIFISGYFSKKKASFKQMLQKLLLPYLVFEVLYYLLYVFVIHKETQLYLFWPKFTLWYLLALFMWKVITPWFTKIPGHFLWAVLLGLWAGCSGLDDNFLTLPRMLYFYPFFLLGVWMQPDTIKQIRNKCSRKQGALGLAVIFAGLAAIAVITGTTPKCFYGRYDYAFQGQSILEGVAVRLVCYAVSLAITLLLVTVMSGRQKRYSYLGERTMAIYLFHGLICAFVKSGWEKTGHISNGLETVLLLGISFLVIALLSRKPFTDLLNWMTGSRKKV